MKKRILKQQQEKYANKPSLESTEQRAKR